MASPTFSASDQSTAATATVTRSRLRYPLRSTAKPKDDKTSASAADALRGGSTSAAVSKSKGRLPTVRSSISVFSSSAKDSSASSIRPTRRLSVPTKSAAASSRDVVSPTSNGSERSATPNLTPESSRPVVRKQRPETTPGAAAASGKKKFSVLSSVSYWLSQIKVSESAARHGISLGFFKLALESGCEPVQRMREELKCYVVKHSVADELGEPAKELLQSYGITEDLEKLKLASQEPNSQNQKGASDLNKQSSSSSRNNVAIDPSRMGRNLKPRSLNPEAPKATKKDAVPAKTLPALKTTRALQNKNDVVKPLAQTGATADGGVKQKQTLSRSKSEMRSSLVRSSMRKSTTVNKDTPRPTTPTAPVSSPPEEVAAENKENQENQIEEAIALEVAA